MRMGDRSWGPTYGAPNVLPNKRVDTKRPYSLSRLVLTLKRSPLGVSPVGRGSIVCRLTLIYALVDLIETINSSSLSTVIRCRLIYYLKLLYLQYKDLSLTPG